MDGRPLSTTRGIGHDIVRLYKSYLRSSAARREDTATVLDPFICLHIHCIRGSYDVNVEPSKDDVLFENPGLILSLVEDLFSGTYGALENSTEKDAVPKTKKRQQNNEFELLMARKRPYETPSQARSANTIYTRSTTSVPHPRRNMPLSMENNWENAEGMVSSGEDTNCKDSSFLNPWAITRMNAPLRTPERPQPRSDKDRRLTTFCGGQEHRWRPGQPHETSVTLLSPTDTSTNSTSLSTSSSQCRPSKSLQIISKETAIETSREQDDKRTLDIWLRNIHSTENIQGSAEENSEHDQAEPFFSQRIQERPGSHGQSPPETPARTVLDPPALCDRLDDTSQVGRSSMQVQDFTSVNKQPQGLPGFEKLSTIIHRVGAGNNTQLEEALDFEHRKKDVMQKRREHMRDLVQSVLKSNQVASPSLHRNRYLAARAALTSNLNSLPESQDISISEKVPSVSTLRVDDPRAYLMRHQNDLSGEGLKIKRTQTSKLPFETIPEGHRLHNISITYPTSPSLSAVSFKEILKSDLYTQRGVEEQGFPPSEDGFPQSWWHRLSTLIKGKYGYHDENSQKTSLEFSSTSLTQNLRYLNEPSTQANRA